MSVIEFLASLVGSLAWPLAVFGVVLLLRNPLLLGGARSVLAAAAFVDVFSQHLASNA